MIWSVSMFGPITAAGTARRRRNGSTSCLREEPPDVGQAAGHRGRSRHGGAHQVRPRPAALASDEIPVGGRGAALARLDEIAVHGDAHRAARLPPFQARILEDAIEPLAFRLALHQPGARHDDCWDDAAAALHDLGRNAQVLDAAIRARPYEDAVDGDFG